MNRYELRFLLFIVLLIVVVPKFGLSDISRSKVKEGIKAYEESQWDESLQYFQDALLDDPENSIGHYNVGDAQYKNKKYEEALKSFEKTLSTQEVPLKGKAYYNLGNTYYQMNKYQEAIQIWEEIRKDHPYNKKVLEAINGAKDRLERLQSD